MNTLPIYQIGQNGNSQNTKLDSYPAVNYPYGWGLMPSNQNNRNAVPGMDNFGDGIHYSEYIPKLIETTDQLGKTNTINANSLDSYFFVDQKNPAGSSSMDSFNPNQGPTDLQTERPKEPYTNYYVQLASHTLHVNPDALISVFFSDANLNHLRDTVVRKVKEITMDSKVAGNDGVDIKTPNMDDFFYYLINIYQNYKVYNGSIVFVNLKNTTSIRAEVAKLNTNALQEYVSKLVSQINMYIYYYRDASQLPEQLSLPTYTAMKGSRSLEYNTGFTSGNPIGVASYNQVGNII